MNLRILVALALLAPFAACDDSAPGSGSHSKQEPVEPFFSVPPYGGPGPDVVAALETVESNAIVLDEFRSPDGGTIVRFIDEDPDGVPSIGVVQAGRSPMIELFPEEEPTPLELFLFLNQSSGSVPERLIEHHQLLADFGEAAIEPRLPFVPRAHVPGGPYPIEEEDEPYHCNPNSFASFFNNWSHDIPKPQKDHEPDLEYEQWYGYFSDYRKIYGGVCVGFTDSWVQVVMEEYVSGSWTAVSGTYRQIEKWDRYLYYRSSALCSNYRRINVETPGPAGSAVYHVSGAWDIWDTCSEG